ncbi:Uncharacterised protein [Kocuria rosea]|jgi:hypothetical protein|nr:Uncharacterised protein [Kocuria rosea]
MLYGTGPRGAAPPKSRRSRSRPTWEGEENAMLDALEAPTAVRSGT